MAIFTSVRGIAGTVGFIAAVLGIGEWTGYLPGWGLKEQSQIASTDGVSTVDIAPDADTDEGRLHALLVQNIKCDGLTFEVTGLDRKDTPASETSSGQPATYLAAFVQIRHEENPTQVEAVGNGRGPGGESRAFTRLLDAVRLQVEDKYSECSKG